ncbi:purine-cytosine permease family protein [Actinomycetospora sp. CA-084318]|uniref:purine-cytosine permease family protein n=1 Tax=Actinomycetospora sp. CA-084318 TaxID=3239892 RepID=UPI003D994A96
MTDDDVAQMDRRIAQLDAEQLPAGDHELHRSGHFAGLYAAENVAGTEFVFGATFVALGAEIVDVLIGLAIGNLLAVLSYRFVTAPIATRTRLSVYTFLDRVDGGLTSKLYNGVNAVVFAVISAAMITVSATALNIVFGFPSQEEAYPTHWGFIVVAIAFGSVAVLVAAYGFNALAEFASICAPWLMVMFVAGGVVLIPALTAAATGSPQLGGLGELIDIGGSTVFTGQTPDGTAGITLLGIIGYAWAANSFAHVGLVDMSLFRYARKSWYGYMSAFGMFLGHYVAWIAAGFMGAAAAAIVSTGIDVISPGTVAFEALGYAGLVVVVIGGWTTANANLYRSGLAGQAILPNQSRQRVTLIIGVLVVIAALFPFIYRGYLDLVTYVGIVLVPIGGILFAEHHLLPRLGMTRFWARYRGVRNVPALVAWVTPVVLAFAVVALDLVDVYFLFVLAFLVAVVVYVVLARQMGAAESYPDGVARDELFAERVAVFHREQARQAPHVDTTDRRPLSQVLLVVWIVALVVIAVAAAAVLLVAPDLATYTDNRDRFFWIAGAGTVIYFVAAYWRLRRTKAHAQRAMAEQDDRDETIATPAAGGS